MRPFTLRENVRDISIRKTNRQRWQSKLAKKSPKEREKAIQKRKKAQDDYLENRNNFITAGKKAIEELEVRLSEGRIEKEYIEFFDKLVSEYRNPFIKTTLSRYGKAMSAIEACEQNDKKVDEAVERMINSL